MPHRKRQVREEPISQVRAQQLGHPKHSANFSKKRNERFSISAVRTIPDVIRLVRRGKDGRSSAEQVNDLAQLNMIPGWAGIA